MTNTSIEKDISEVLEYLKGIRKEDLEKIPPKFMNFLKENASKDYKPNFDYTKPLSELELTSTSRAIISHICYSYWCENEEERKEFCELLQNNEEIYEKEWEEKTENMFTTRKKTREKIVNSNLPVKKENNIGIFTKIKNFIKNIITKKKRDKAYGNIKFKR